MPLPDASKRHRGLVQSEGDGSEVRDLLLTLTRSEAAALADLLSNFEEPGWHRVRPVRASRRRGRVDDRARKVPVADGSEPVATVAESARYRSGVPDRRGGAIPDGSRTSR